MGWKEINKREYINQIKEKLNLTNSEDIIEKDLLLTLILAEFEKRNLGKDLIFKGGTLLSRNFLEYHRFSEDLDFIHKDSSKLRLLSRNQRERRIKDFIDTFCPILKQISDELDLKFDANRNNEKFCKIRNGRTVYTFKIYYSETKFIKVEINFVEDLFFAPKKVSVKAITDMFDAKELLFKLNLNYKNFNVRSYSIKEITLEKYRAILTRGKYQERDLFDLFLIKDSLNVNKKDVLRKIENSSLIQRSLKEIIALKLKILETDKFFKGEDKIEELAIYDFSKKEFLEFEKKVKPLLIDICKEFLEK